MRRGWPEGCQRGDVTSLRGCEVPVVLVGVGDAGAEQRAVRLDLHVGLRFDLMETLRREALRHVLAVLLQVSNATLETASEQPQCFDVGEGVEVVVHGVTAR